MDDLISRQAAVESMREMYHAAEKWGEKASEDMIKARAESCMASLIEMKLRIENLPSAVVRCKECRWWDQKDDSPYGYCHAAKHAYYSAHWEIGIYRTYKPDWFCADGERKDDV